MNEDRYTRAWPELGLINSPEDRKKVLRTCQKRMFGRLLLTGFAVGGVQFLARFSNVTRWIRGFWWEVCVIMYLSLCAGLVLGLANKNRLRRLVRQELHERGIPVCMNCGYDLRGQTEPRCPECGKPIEVLPRNGGGGME